VDKEILEKIKKFKAKEKEEKTWKQVQDTFTQVKEIVQRNIEKEDRTKFNQPWLLLQSRLLVNNSTTILKQAFEPTF